MMKDKFTLAIYSGNIPSTTFIENLIEGMAESGMNIVLFGKMNRRVSYAGNVRIMPTPQNTPKLAVFVLKESMKLIMRDRRKFAGLYSSVRNRTGNSRQFLRDMGAMLPVINEDPGIFHVQWAKTVQVYPELFEHLTGKIAVSLRGAHINYSPLNDPSLADAYRKYFPGVSAFHAVSQAIKLEAAKYGADPEKTTVIYTSVRDELLNTPLPQSKKDRKIRIISVGRFHWKKGYHYGLDAMHILGKKGVEFQYDLVAQGDVPEEILFLINEYGLKGSVNILPGMEHSELMAKVRSSDALLLPSVEEGIANVVLEAMAAGVPVITTDCGGMNEVVMDGENGFITGVRDAEALAAKIEMLARMNTGQIRAITESARETVRSRFTREIQKKSFAAFYNKLAA